MQELMSFSAMPRGSATIADQRRQMESSCQGNSSFTQPAGMKSNSPGPQVAEWNTISGQSSSSWPNCALLAVCNHCI
eukprot:12255896-Alexandrium_andersonii.AAC.1